MKVQPIVVKVSGHEIDQIEFLTAFAQTIKTLAQPAVIVHGGGREITELQQKMGIEPRYVDGLRVTDAASLALVEMVLCGTVNTRLVRLLVEAGVEALGMSGVDRGVIRAKRLRHAEVDMGFTGAVSHVRGEILLGLIASGVTPVLAPICIGDGCAYNVNADHVAGAVAAATAAERLVFLTNVRGVMVDGTVLPALTAGGAEDLIARGIIFGGMIPKVRTALDALISGVQQVVITDLEGLRIGGGTAFTQD